MNLLPDAEQAQIVDTMRAFLSEQAPVARLRPPCAQIGNDDVRFLPQLGKLGFLGVAIPESEGGIGLGAAEEMLAHREFGRHLLSPAILGVTLAAHLAVASDGRQRPAELSAELSAEPSAELLAELLAGRCVVGLACPRGAVQLGPVSNGEFHLLDADKSALVLIVGHTATVLLRREQFSDVETVLGTDNLVGLQRARLRAARALMWRDHREGGLHERALLLAAAYAVGMAEATRDMAVDYAKVREQFGKPIGSFQAVKHLCADMAVRAEAALCQTSMASLVIAERKPGADFHATSAKIVATKAALENAAQNIQVHGAFGFTSEADAHLFLKRAHVMDQFAGDSRLQRARLIDMPFPEAA